MMTRRRDMKPLIGTPDWINNEVRERFMEGLNRRINILLEDKE